MKSEKLKELLKQAYRWGVDNGSLRSEKNFNDFLETSAVKQALTRTFVIKDIEYDTGGEDVDLPETLTITVPEDVEDEDIDEYLSDEISNITGFCHKGFTVEGEEE